MSPGGPVVRAPHFRCRGTKIPQAGSTAEQGPRAGGRGRSTHSRRAWESVQSVAPQLVPGKDREAEHRSWDAGLVCHSEPRLCR